MIPNITETDQLLYLARQDFNCKGLVIGKGLVRNLPKLARFIEATKSVGISPTVIANDFCPTPNCPERVTDHNNVCAHKHLPFDNDLGEQHYISPSIYCRQIVMRDPSMYLKAATINPNSLAEYEGIGASTFKLTDRVMPDDQIMRVCRAYFDRDYDGNIFDLFSYTSHMGNLAKGQRELLRAEVEEILRGGYDELRRHRGSFVAQPYASAKELANSGFMAPFRRGTCFNRCHDEVFNPRGCRHCVQHTNQLVRIDNQLAGVVQRNIKLLVECATRPIQDAAPASSPEGKMAPR